MKSVGSIRGSKTEDGMRHAIFMIGCIFINHAKPNSNHITEPSPFIDTPREKKGRQRWIISIARIHMEGFKKAIHAVDTKRMMFGFNFNFCR